MNNKYLEKYLNDLMCIHEFDDYAPNGLQIEGAENISSLIISPSISLKVIEKAIKTGAQGILVHHGMFWKNEPRIISGPYKQRLKLLLMENLNLYAYHLPLDKLPDYGNNAPVLKDLGMMDIKSFANIGYSGKFESPVECDNFFKILNQYYETAGIHLPKNGKIQNVAIVSGNGVYCLQSAIDQGFDAFITGEGSEWVYNMAIENNLAFSAMGHYKSECIGVKLIGKHIEEKFNINTEFFMEKNPF